MAVNSNTIGGSDYQSIANAYARLKYHLDIASTYLYTAVNTVVDLNQLDPTLDLIYTFNSVYVANVNSVNTVSPYLAAVTTLNNHCINRGGYTDINAYLADAGITVPQKWADLCADAGFTVSGSYINGSFVY
jgi:hypothetical protein